MEFDPDDKIYKIEKAKSLKEHQKVVAELRANLEKLKVMADHLISGEKLTANVEVAGKMYKLEGKEARAFGIGMKVVFSMMG